MTPATDRLDIDGLMREIRAEVAERLPTPGIVADVPASVHSTPRAAPPLPRLGAFADELPKQARYRAADFLAYHDEDFVRQAYRRVLGREPDREGASRYLAKIRAGELSRIEVLGRIRFSAEGRAAAVPVGGLALPFAVRAARRVPAVGRLLGIVQYLWRLPDLAHNHEVLESAVFANRAELRSKVNTILDEVEQRLAAAAGGAEVDALAARVGQVERDKAHRSDVNALATGLNARLATVEAQVGSAFMRLDESDRERFDAAQRITALVEDLVRTRRAVDALRDGNQALAQRLVQLPSLEQLAVGRERAEREVACVAAPSPHESAPIADAALVHDEAFYVAFEDRFRGTREDIKQRVAVYLPIVRAAGAGVPGAPLLDVGCGRGEWLELLREEQLVARGVDTNPVAVAGCQARGLDAVAADALQYMGSLADASLGAVSAIHVIEHLPFTRLLELFDEVRRVLRPGGVVVFETPNPENLVVGACNFYYDPTHERPLPPEPFRFILEARGFDRVEIIRLHRDTHAPDLSFLPTELAGVLAQRLFGSQDYALVGFRR